MSNQVKGWIGVDLDGTLATYGEWKGPEHIGDPIPAMVNRVKAWIAEGKNVRIFTARCSGDRQGLEVQETVQFIKAWCKEHIGVVLPVTCQKDYGMIQLWDDRCVQVIPNQGVSVEEAYLEAREAVATLKRINETLCATIITFTRPDGTEAVIKDLFSRRK
jgi:hypothetical protein